MNASQKGNGGSTQLAEAIWGWDEQIQQAFHPRSFDPPKTQIDVDHRAHARCERLGFQDVTRHDTNTVKIRMSATPQPADDPIQMS